MNNLFELAAGSVTGRDHAGRGNLLLAKNNQDAFCHQVTDDALVAFVCDGCSSGAHSEVGAQIGARLLTRELVVESSPGMLARRGMLLQPQSMPALLEMVRQNVVRALLRLAMVMVDRTGCLPRVIAEFLLFTSLGVLVTREWTACFSIGDGVFFINGEMTRLGPFPQNEPPYLAYALVRSSISEALVHFQIHQCLPTAKVQSILIGCDGIADLVAAAERNVPGKPGLVGPISQFWRDDCYFRPDQIRRRLALVNSEVVSQDLETKVLVRSPGLLPDDTTLVVIRRKQTVPGT
jgi:hypothetical protein